MNSPTISVILSVYNGERYLREAVDSILAQSYRDFELVLVDDGSTDASASVVDEYGQRDNRVVVVHQSNSGLVASLNRGCGLAQGKYLARMDADDVALPGRLEGQLGYMENHPEIAVLGTAVEMIDHAGRSLCFPKRPTEPAAIHTEMLDRNVLFHPSILMRRDVFHEVGGYRRIDAAEDYDIWLRVGECYPLASLPTVLLQYRVHDCQMTETRAREMTISNLVTRAAAFARRSGAPDPLAHGCPVTLEGLEELIAVVVPASLAALASDEPETWARTRSYFRWLLQAAVESERCQEQALEALGGAYWRRAPRRYAAEARYAAARLSLRRRDYWRTMRDAVVAATSSPSLICRMLKPVRSAIGGARDEPAGAASVEFAAMMGTRRS